jgi:hypothetical protein
MLPLFLLTFSILSYSWKSSYSVVSLVIWNDFLGGAKWFGLN